MLTRRVTQPAYMYVAISSYLGAAYLWILSIVYVPQTVMLAYTFILTGAAIAAARITDVVKTREVNAKNSYSSGVILIGVFSVAVVLTLVVLAANIERISTTITLTRAVAAANSGDLDRAEIIAGRASLLNKNDARGAQLRTNIGLAKLSEILNTENEDVEAQRELFQQELTKTISAAQEVVSADVGDYRNWLLLADIYANLVPLNIEGSYDSAVDAYEKARVLNDKSPLVPISLSQLAFASEDMEGARTYAMEALELKSNYTDAYYILSQIAIQEGNTQEAIESTEAAVLLRPNNTGLLFQLGVLQYSIEEYEKVVSVLERAVTIYPSYSNALYFLGLAYDKVDNSEGALAVFEQIAALNEENEEVKEIVEVLKEGGSVFDVVDEDAPETSETGELPVSEDN